MAQLTGMPSPQKGVALKGSVVITTWKGKIILRSWPRKRGKIKSAKQQATVDWFTQANVLTKYLAPELQMVALQAVKNTPLYPRDVQLACMAGTLFSLIDPSGKILYSMQTRQAVSDSLNVLSQDDGVLLTRQNGLWVPIAPGEAGQVLTAPGDETPPYWAGSGGGGGGVWTGVAQTSTITAGALALSGLTLTPYQAIQVRFAQVTPVTNAQRLRVQLELSGAFVATGYKYGVNLGASSATIANFSSAGTTGAFITGDNSGWAVGNDPLGGFSGILNLHELTAAPHKHMDWVGSWSVSPTVMVRATGGAVINSSNPVTGIRILDTANNLLSGKMIILGLTA